MSASQLAFPRLAFDQCAAFYDETINPVAALNERILRTLLPDAKEKRVLDIGCGTGRILTLWREFGPQNLIGIDISSEMLGIARKKHHDLLRADCGSLPVANDTADFASCCLTLGYLPDLAAFARELARVVKPGGFAFVSELHPATAQRFGWKRTFGSGGRLVTLRSNAFSLRTVLRTFADAGFTADIVLEPPFGQPEGGLFESASRSDKFHLFGDAPALYVLRLRCRDSVAREASGQLRFTNACVALGPSTACLTNVEVRDCQIQALGTESNIPSVRNVDLSRYLLLPGLINAHDHLEFALFPRLGRGRYRNSREWADDIYRPSESPIREHLKVPKWVRLWWGGIRNLLAGVTTVCHHNPYDVSIFDNDFPVRVVREFDWSHSLAFDRETAAKFQNTPPDSPFVVHVGEGIDSTSKAELEELDRIGALDHRTTVVHGIALHDEGLGRLNKLGAGLVWCPSSNRFLFGQTLCPRQVATVSRCALGTDSPLTSSGDFLDELGFARRLGSASDFLYWLATTGARRTLMLRRGEGQLLPGGMADFIAVPDDRSDPADRLSSLSHKDIALVVGRGKVNLASDELMQQLPPELTSTLEPLFIDDTKRWVRAPIRKLLHLSREALGPRLTMHGRVLSQ